MRAALRALKKKPVLTPKTPSKHVPRSKKSLSRNPGPSLSGAGLVSMGWPPSFGRVDVARASARGRRGGGRGRGSAASPASGRSKFPTWGPKGGDYGLRSPPNRGDFGAFPASGGALRRPPRQNLAPPATTRVSALSKVYILTTYQNQQLFFVSSQGFPVLIAKVPLSSSVHRANCRMPPRGSVQRTPQHHPACPVVPGPQASVYVVDLLYQCFGQF